MTSITDPEDAGYGLAARRFGPYEVSDDHARLDLDLIHGFLAQSYWAEGIPKDRLGLAVQNSWCFGLYHDTDGQIGFARVVTDFATFAYLADVFVVEAHRRKRLGQWLVDTVLAQLQPMGLRRLMLATADAHTLYTRFGFKPLAAPERWMERYKPYA